MRSRGRPMSRTRIQASCGARTTSILRPACTEAGRCSSRRPRLDGARRAPSRGAVERASDPGRRSSRRGVGCIRAMRLGAPALPCLRHLLRGSDELSQEDRRRPWPGRAAPGARDATEGDQGAAGRERFCGGRVCRAGTCGPGWLRWAYLSDRVHFRASRHLLYQYGTARNFPCHSVARRVPRRQAGTGREDFRMV